MLPTDEVIWGDRLKAMFSLPPGINLDFVPDDLAMDPSAFSLPAAVTNTSAVWDRVAESLNEARRTAAIGEAVPPMHTLKGLRRRVASALVRVMLRILQVVTREQRRYNFAQITAVEEVIRHIREVDDTIDSLHLQIREMDLLRHHVNHITKVELPTLHSATDSAQQMIQAVQAAIQDLQAKIEHVSVTQVATLRDKIDVLNKQLKENQTEIGRLVQLREEVAAVEQDVRLLQSRNSTQEISQWAAALKTAEQTSGIWVNPPMSIEYEAPNTAKIAWVNERVVEQPFVLSHVCANAQAGQCVLDLGGAESFVPVQLATMGYRVTMVDIRSSHLVHPMLTHVVADLRSLPFPTASFDVAYCLSTVEHVGLGHYGDELDPEGDITALREAWRILRPGGTFIISTPVGIPAQTDLQRIYSPERLIDIVSLFFSIEQALFFKSKTLGDRQFWVPSDAEGVHYVDSSDRVQSVGLIVARRNITSDV